MLVDPYISHVESREENVVAPRTAEVLILTGPPGAGKSTVADALVRAFGSPAVHLDSDAFWHFIKQGWIAPYLSEAQAQNQVVIEVLAPLHGVMRGVGTSWS